MRPMARRARRRSSASNSGRSAGASRPWRSAASASFKAWRWRARVSTGRRLSGLQPLRHSLQGGDQRIQALAGLQRKRKTVAARSRQIGLVPDQQIGRRQIGRQAGAGIGQAAVQQQQGHAGRRHAPARGARLRLPRHRLSARRPAVSATCTRIAAQLQPHLDHIAGGAGHFRDDRDVAPRQGIDQRSFCRHWAGRRWPAASLRAAPRRADIVHMCLYLLTYFNGRAPGRSEFRLANTVIGKIDRRFGPGQRPRSAPPRQPS